MIMAEGCADRAAINHIAFGEWRCTNSVMGRTPKVHPIIDHSLGIPIVCIQRKWSKMLKSLMLSTCLVLSLPASVMAAEPAPRPLACADDPKFTEQDFTIGLWDVFSGAKQTAQVRMERSLGGCAIHEVWSEKDGAPGSGLGLFTYSRLLKNWHYLWSSDTGAATSFLGSLIKPGEMRYVTTRPLADGRSRLRHWSLILQADGRVRELAVGSEDDGKTWTTEYDLMWVRAGQ
jgi:hypothetical protein